MKKLFLLAMLAVFQLSALKAQGDSPKVYTPVENYKFEVKDGKRFQEITIVDKVDVFNEEKRDKYIEENGLGYSIEQYCRILEKTAEYMVKYDSEGDVNAASTFCNYLYAGLDYGNGPIWGLGDLKRKEFKKNLKNLLKSKTPTDEEISYYNRIVETVEHYLDSVIATWVDTVTVERKFYMPVDMNDTIVNYREVAIKSGCRYIDRNGRSKDWNKRIEGGPFSMEWFEVAKLGGDRFEDLSEENKRLCFVRYLAYRWYPIDFYGLRTEFLFDFRYKNGDYVNGAKLQMSYKEDVDVREDIKEFSLTKDKGVHKGGESISNEFILNNGDVLKNIESRPYAGRGSELYEADYFPYSGELYSASGEFKDKLSGGKWESELKAEEEARKKAKEAAAQAEMEALRKELVAKYGEKMANAYLEGELMVGMPKELLDKFMDRYNYRYLGKTNWSGDTIRYRYARSLIFSVEEVYLYVRNGKLVDFTIYND